MSEDEDQESSVTIKKPAPGNPVGKIEFRVSKCCCPPDRKRAGLHIDEATWWVRVDEGPWFRIVRIDEHIAKARKVHDTEEYFQQLTAY